MVKPLFSGELHRTHGSSDRWDLVFSRLVLYTNICLLLVKLLLLGFNFSVVKKRGGKKYFGLLI